MEQRIGRGKVNIRESVTSGLANAVSGAIYGNHPLKSAKDALVRGAGAGAATAAINHLSNAWDSRKNTQQGNSWNPGSMAGGTGISPYMTKRDPKAGCVTASPVKSSIGYSGGYGYQYKTPGGSQKGRNENSIVSFGKDVLIGAAMGGLSSVSFYGADKALGSLKRSIRGDKGGSQTVGRPAQGQGFSERGYNPKPGERTFDGYVRNNVSAGKETTLHTSASGFNTSAKNAEGQFKRFGSEPKHGIDGPHVHQPTRNVAPSGTIYGGQGNKTFDGGVTKPNSKDIRQLYEFLNNNKYQKF